MPRTVKTIAQELGVLDETQKKTLRIAIRELLNKREVEVLDARLGLDRNLPRTLEQVGIMQGITKERVRQIEAWALRRLRHPANRKRLMEFFTS